MEKLEQEHLALLQKRPSFLPIEYVHRYYGLCFKSPLAGFYSKWKSGIKGSDRCPDGQFDRILLEIFLQSQKMVSVKWMGAYLGMTEASLRSILQRKDDLGLAAVYVYFDELVLESFKDDILQGLPSLRFRTFGNHNDFCRHLHEALRKELNFSLEELPCETSITLGEQPPLFAHYFDCLTFQALSVKHSVWLDFRKPLSLPPDRCSKLFLANNLEELQPFVAGSSLPDLKAYPTPKVA